MLVFQRGGFDLDLPGPGGGSGDPVSRVGDKLPQRERWPRSCHFSVTDGL